MQAAKKQTHYLIALDLGNGKSKLVNIKAGSRAVAENRALKHNKNALGIKGD